MKTEGIIIIIGVGIMLFALSWRIDSLDKGQERILKQQTQISEQLELTQELLSEQVNGISRNLNNLDLYYKVTKKEKK